MRTKVTVEEFNVVQKYLTRSGMDAELIMAEYDESRDMFYDLENSTYISLAIGFGIIYESVQYPLMHDLDTFDEAIMLRSLLMEYCYLNDYDTKWMLDSVEG